MTPSRSWLMVMMVAACGGRGAAPAMPAGAPASTVPSAPGQVALRIGAPPANLPLPIRMAAAGRTIAVTGPGVHRLELPSRGAQLTAVEFAPVGTIWVRVDATRAQWFHDDPCCGLAYDGNTYDDRIASCATDDVCPDGLEPVYPGLASDPVCGDARRCVPPAAVRLVDAGQVVQPFAAVATGARGIADVALPATTGGAGRRVTIAVEHGACYQVELAGGTVRGVVWTGTAPCADATPGG